MAYLIVPNYNNEAVLCQKPCEHQDCAANRLDWFEDGNCRYCGKKLMPGEKFIYLEHGSTAKAHFICTLEKEEASCLKKLLSKNG